jgi:sugar/nucleoside kinase (ribokinase family)
MSVTAIGSVALDSLILPAGEYQDLLGGSLSHFATACSLFDSGLSVVGVVGEDFPPEHMEYFRSRGIGTEGLEVASGKTFRWKGQYREGALDEAITLDTQLNVFESFEPRLSVSGSPPRFLFLGNIHPRIQYRAAESVQAKLKILDTMNLWIATTREELLKTISLIDVLVLNEGEAGDLTGCSNLVQAGKKAIALGPSVVIIKRGEHGAMLVSKEDVFMVPGYPVSDVLDPTGAGDSFAGGFVGYLSECEDLTPISLRTAVVYGNTLGSFNVEGVGVARLANTTRQEVDQRFEEYKAMVSI